MHINLYVYLEFRVTLNQFCYIRYERLTHGFGRWVTYVLGYVSVNIVAVEIEHYIIYMFLSYMSLSNM